MPSRRPEGRGRAFGLTLDVGFPFPGLPPGDGGNPIAVDLARRNDLPDMPPDSSVLWERRRGDGRRTVFLRQHPDVGWQLTALSYGTFHIDAAVRQVRCAPVRTARDHWQRFLVGQILPLASTLRHHEVFHASVVRIGDAGIAFTSASGGGKSTLATALQLGGVADFVADDVMAIGPGLTPSDACALAEPGFGLLSVRRSAIELLGADAVHRLGREVGGDDEGIRLAVKVHPEPVPIRAVYVVGRVHEPAPLVEPLQPVDPRILLASTYNFLISTPDRLIRQLDVCALLARTAVIARVNIGPDHGPGAVAAAVTDHLRAIS